MNSISHISFSYLVQTPDPTLSPSESPVQTPAPTDPPVSSCQSFALIKNQLFHIHIILSLTSPPFFQKQDAKDQGKPVRMSMHIFVNSILSSIVYVISDKHISIFLLQYIHLNNLYDNIEKSECININDFRCSSQFSDIIQLNLFHHYADKSPHTLSNK